MFHYIISHDGWCRETRKPFLQRLIKNNIALDKTVKSITMDMTMNVRNGERVKVGDICVFATPRGTQVMKITEIRDADSVYAKGVTDSGARWVCNILRHATDKESENLMEKLRYESEFSEWFNKQMI